MLAFLGKERRVSAESLAQRTHVNNTIQNTNRPRRTLQRSDLFIRRCLCLGWSWDAPDGWKSGCSRRCRRVVTGGNATKMRKVDHRVADIL